MNNSKILKRNCKRCKQNAECSAIEENQKQENKQEYTQLSLTLSLSPSLSPVFSTHETFRIIVFIRNIRIHRRKFKYLASIAVLLSPIYGLLVLFMIQFHQFFFYIFCWIFYYKICCFCHCYTFIHFNYEPSLLFETILRWLFTWSTFGFHVFIEIVDAHHSSHSSKKTFPFI